MEPRSGIIVLINHHPPTNPSGHPATRPPAGQTCFWILCGVPTQVRTSEHILLYGVPPSVFEFCTVSPPQFEHLTTISCVVSPPPILSNIWCYVQCPHPSINIWTHFLGLKFDMIPSSEILCQSSIKSPPRFVRCPHPSINIWTQFHVRCPHPSMNIWIQFHVRCPPLILKSMWFPNWLLCPYPHINPRILVCPPNPVLTIDMKPSSGMSV